MLKEIQLSELLFVDDMEDTGENLKYNLKIFTGKLIRLNMKIKRKQML